MTTTQNTTETITSLEIGNALRISGTDITGSVVGLVGDLNGRPVGGRVTWSDGDCSVERFPIVGIEFV